MLRLSLLFILVFICNLLSYGGSGFSKRYILLPNQFPSQLSKAKPSWIYVFISSPDCRYSTNRFSVSVKGDTIINYKKFVDSVGCSQISYRLIFQNEAKIDSVWQMNKEFKLTDKVFPLLNGKLKIYAYDIKGLSADNFVFDYARKYREAGNKPPDLRDLLGKETVYTSYDRNRYASASVWMLSIGIDDYGNIKWKNSKSDAVSYVEYFKNQFRKFNQNSDDSIFNAWTLLDKDATKDSILKVLKEIATRSSTHDYFIFNFSGQSNLFTPDSINYFFPYDVSGYIFTPKNRKTGDTINVLNSMISQNLLQEYIQLIPATNQLFISEAGPSEKFKTEFIKSLMNNSIALAGILNKNRVIIVPNNYGLDDFNCGNRNVGKAPLNYAITTLDTAYNIYNLFDEGEKADRVAYLLKTMLFQCQSSMINESYLDVFFEKKFLKEHESVSGSTDNKTRGIKPKQEKLKEIAGLTGKRYALVIGTNNYKGEGWYELSNPVYDATEVANELENSYGFEVTLLKDPIMDSIYKAIRNYYLTLTSNDQLIIYFAGHGDYDNGLMDDGFIVCADSKAIDDDPVRNSYIQYSKLQKMINKIPARQILLMLDVCHAGVFDANVLGKQRDNPASNITNRNVLEFLKDKAQYKTRKMLSSVGKEAAFDGGAGKHSPFANLLLQVLRTRGSGSNGLLTLADIYSVLQTASMNESATLKISPHIAGFGDNDPMSEFILIPTETKN